MLVMMMMSLIRKEEDRMMVIKIMVSEGEDNDGRERGEQQQE